MPAAATPASVAAAGSPFSAAVFPSITHESWSVDADVQAQSVSRAMWVNSVDFMKAARGQYSSGRLVEEM